VHKFSDERRGQLFICISCRPLKGSSAKKNGCKCLIVSDPVCTPANVQPAGENKDQGELKIQCKKPDLPQDIIAYIQFMEQGWELEEILKA
jgi:hypothetical protein